VDDPIHMSLQGADIVGQRNPHLYMYIACNVKYLRFESEIIVSEVPRLNCFLDSM